MGSSAALMILGCLGLNTVPLAAQGPELDWSEERELLGVNALLGAMTAGLAAALLHLLAYMTDRA